jgi:hypothetical protein
MFTLANLFRKDNLHNKFTPQYVGLTAPKEFGAHLPLVSIFFMNPYFGDLLWINRFLYFTVLAIEDGHIVNYAAVTEDNVNMLRPHGCFGQIRKLSLPMPRKVNSHKLLLR